ncbi:Phage tail protein [Sulfidibacter corallicola]|uniref:Phage tail protein n=1 Tax=Sulfidibacter corallicola TaxID=2818388 RepID=A0A8A4TPL0_SULCO|nr:tail fiber protein [Sulfidibacter corallicola]QTD51909.1 phage tail protein [Sulfidibacter corallicola]
MSEPYVGEIRTFPYTYAPDGWLDCDGATRNIQEFPALFAVIGARYGGDGQTTFAVPDIKGRAAMGFGEGPDLTPASLGDQVGANLVVLEDAHLPTHRHEAFAEQDLADNASPQDGFISIFQDSGGVGVQIYGELSDPLSSVQMNDAMLTETGGGEAHLNMQPYQVLRYCIAHTGVFPPRP